MSRQPPIRPEDVSRALVIRPRFVGDLCLTLPVVDHLRRHAPHAEIDYLVEAPFAPLLTGDPRLARVFAAPRSASALRTLPLLAALRARRYDLVLDLYCNPRTAVWTAATGARVRVGYSHKGWRTRVYNRPISPTALSAVHFHLESIAGLGWDVDPSSVPRLRPSDAARHRAESLLAADGVPPASRLVLLHPGATRQTRRWAPERYVILAQRVLARESDVVIRVLAGPGDEPLARQVAEGAADARCRALAGVPLADLPAVLERADAFVGGDTGPLHVSVASGTPTVGLFGRNQPETFFPYSAVHGHRAIYTGVWCSPCHLDECAHLTCMWTVTPEMVDRALAECLAARRAGKSAEPDLAVPVRSSG